MWSLGFGLELIGVLVLKRPKLFSLLALLAIGLSSWAVSDVRFNGNITAVLPQQSDAFVNYRSQKTTYRDFSRDISIVVESDRLFTASGLEDLRYLQLELAVTEGVASVTSVFSVPEANPVTGEFEQHFPEIIDNDEQATLLLTSLLAKRPEASSLVALEKKAALLLVTMETGIQDDNTVAGTDYVTLRKATQDAAPEDFKVTMTGLTPIGVTIVGALINDQVKLTLFGLLLGTGIAFYVFRTFIAALICALPPALTVLWSLSLFSLFNVPINFLTTVLPTLALILAFADGIVIFFKWQRANAQGGDLRDNLFEAIRKVGPASALTSLTTAIAFFSFSISESEALKEFAYLGVGAVMLAFLSVMVGLPLGLHWAMRFGIVTPEKAKKTAFGSVGSAFGNLSVTRPATITIGAILLVVGLVFVHLAIKAEYRVTDYLPVNSEARQGEQLTNDLFGGRSILFMSVPVAVDGPMHAPQNRQRLNEVETMMEAMFDDSLVFSINRLWREFETEEAINNAMRQLEEGGFATSRSYVSRGGDRLLVSIRIPSDQSINVTLQQIRAVKASLATLDYGKDIVVSGFPVLMAEEFTRLIEQLRQSLLIAIFLGVVIIGFATRSPLLSLAAVTPNLLPVLAVELVLYLRGGSINLSEVSALTVAFGIAIDNAVHVINVYSYETARGRRRYESVIFAVKDVGPALAASTAIICVAVLVTQISSLPTVPILGQLMVATLLVALVANLAILPANILTLVRIKRYLFER